MLGSCQKMVGVMEGKLGIATIGDVVGVELAFIQSNGGGSPWHFVVIHQLMSNNLLGA